MASLIKTRILIISDTHGLRFEPDKKPLEPADVVIHCGDLTNDSMLHDFEETIQLLKEVNAPIKIAIAGNHDFSLDNLAFKEKIDEASRLAQEDLDESIKKSYGDYGDARRLLLEAKDQGIIFLEEGSHQIPLHNSALLNLYASPYTPASGGSRDWGFQYSGAHDFKIAEGTDVVITHGPPHGIMDMTAEKQRIGCPQLFAAVAKAQPRLHCFGHVHNSWGAKLVSWRPQISEKPSHFTDIDNDKSVVIESLARLKGTNFESPEDRKTRQNTIQSYRSRRCCSTSHCKDDERLLASAAGETLFVNAALMADGGLSQFPWLVDIELKKGESNSGDINSGNGSEVILEETKRANKLKRKASSPFMGDDEVKKARSKVGTCSNKFKT
ncbi:Metallophosphoesterase domain-containing protein 1 [Fusarium austroafricanum]|uniref:Metallophosphoesterase domain-containing protein 1 n=1 Tax=Fusarium austroafricanum TaxID=2364996 RepID=A0A8H4KI93_9HYPO|nr:Metallophosphoesterase domain-containing protein 1 [Fusarium austroafricanum]